MAEMVCSEITGENAKKENPTEKPTKKDTVPHTQREKKKVPQKTLSHNRRQFYNTDYRGVESFSSGQDREKVKRFRHPYRGYWQGWSESDQWINPDSKTSGQYHHDNTQYVRSQYHWRSGKRTGHKSTNSKLTSTQDAVKERKKKITEEESVVKEKATEQESVKKKTIEEQLVKNVTDENGEKTVKKRPDVDKSDLTKAKTEDSLTDRVSNQTTNNTQARKIKKQKEPVMDDDKATDKKKDLVIMVGKHQLKKIKPTSASSVIKTEEDTANRTSNSKTTSDKATNQTTSTHAHKKRNYNKVKGPVKHYGGVASSLQSDVLSQQLFTGQYECMVCCERVRVKDPVWSCSTCYHIFHLKCIKKWAKIPTNVEEG